MKNKKIMLAVGLFDRDTKKQEIKTEEAMTIVNNILLQYTEGATVYIGSGIYRHIDDTIIIEPNIIIILYDVNNEAVNKIIQEAGQQLNQETIMEERSEVQLDFIQVNY